MLYYLFGPLGKQYLIFNLFNYLSFRAAGAMVTALLIAFLVGPGIIRRLREKKVGQVIRAEGPASHQGKRGTPTMGGIIILLATVIPTLLWARVDSRNVLFALLAILWTGGIGFIDDYLKIVQGKSRGLDGLAHPAQVDRVLLLDVVLTHLDQRRRQRVLAQVERLDHALRIEIVLQRLNDKVMPAALAAQHDQQQLVTAFFLQQHLQIDQLLGPHLRLRLGQHALQRQNGLAAAGDAHHL